MNKEKLLDNLIKFLIDEDKTLQISIPSDYIEKRILLRSLMNIRNPYPIKPYIVKMQNELLLKELEDKEIINPYNLSTIGIDFKSSNIYLIEKIVLWKGDITCLSADVIVNAANSKMLGCFSPSHKCIDNAIHSAAGMELRLECNKIMEIQSHDELTGNSKLTKAYNLPSKYILHTVGPIIYSVPSEDDCSLLASCYTSCLDKANKYDDIRTIAFCCISTGEFRFPNAIASKIAVESVFKWLKSNKNRIDRIVFNVFTTEDYNEYSKLFRKYN